MELDKRSFAIIIIITTLVSYIIIRKFFSIAPRYLLYGILGIFIGLIIGTSIAWPMAKLLGEIGVVVAPYALGIILLVFIEFFIVEGPKIISNIKKKYVN